MNIILHIASLHKSLPKLLAITCLTALLACGGGSGDDDSSGLSNNACGVVGLNSRIINGTECSNSQNSGIVRIFIDNGEGLCTGTMITPTQVLTAAHCFDGSTDSASIVIGDDVASGTRIFATGVVPHPGYKSSDDNTFDLAVLNLSSPANLATLPIVIGRSVADGDVVSIFGFGTDENENPNAVLKSGEMKISEVRDLQIGAAFNGDGSNTCFGDSGGPLLLGHNQRIGIVGILSFGTREDCREGDTSFFTNVQADSILQFLSQVAPAAEII